MWKFFNKKWLIVCQGNEKENVPAAVAAQNVETTQNAPALAPVALQTKSVAKSKSRVCSSFYHYLYVAYTHLTFTRLRKKQIFFQKISQWMKRSSSFKNNGNAACQLSILIFVLSLQRDHILRWAMISLRNGQQPLYVYSEFISAHSLTPGTLVTWRWVCNPHNSSQHCRIRPSLNSHHRFKICNSPGPAK